MSYPPPPGPNDQPSQPPAGGFGPPGSFGPPEQPTVQAPGGYGYPGAPGGPGYPGGGGGYPGPGGPYPPQQPEGGNGPKIAAAVIIGALLVAAIVVSVVLLTHTDDKGDDADGKHSPTPTDTATGDPSTDPTDSASPTPSESESETALPTGDPTDPFIPYVVLEPGTCFDHPLLDSSVKIVERRKCTEPHDGQVITNHTLTGEFKTEKLLQDKVLELCKKDANERLQTIGDGRFYYFYALYPRLASYQYQNQDVVSCALTLSNSKDGKKLDAPLSGS
ncbi:hypothetical protein SRB5_60390 [Streptomyces sp. RB5]|uniref:Septum formation-related domain-containing protein n=1 Tax=Streptomyces smaragdinus TaxID=2585196 RepID=A0A7K0CQT0_9ACTN|nr:hypothetical protein [Streptomyces smaragdinus]MQY15848.1 hypothetical protein [Streptomyces smaragdinus]